MADQPAKPMTGEAFLAWQQTQEDRQELVDGVSVVMRDPRPR